MFDRLMYFVWTFAEAGLAPSRAFNLLFAYIAGANTGGQTIAMTTPVQQGGSAPGGLSHCCEMGKPRFPASILRQGWQLRAGDDVGPQPRHQRCNHQGQRGDAICHRWLSAPSRSLSWSIQSWAAPCVAKLQGVQNSAPRLVSST